MKILALTMKGPWENDQHWTMVETPTYQREFHKLTKKNKDLERFLMKKLNTLNGETFLDFIQGVKPQDMVDGREPRKYKIPDYRIIVTRDMATRTYYLLYCRLKNKHTYDFLWINKKKRSGFIATSNEGFCVEFVLLEDAA